MLFNSIIFTLVFLPISLLIYLLLWKCASKSASKWWLALVSILFYTWWYPPYTLLFLVSILFNYLISSKIQKTQSKCWLILGVVANLMVIIYYKYSKFLLGDIVGVDPLPHFIENIALPLAISFYTFQQITYLVDSYKREVSSSSFGDYLLYVTFFPQLIAGPIVHHSEVMPQFKSDKRDYNWGMFASGCCLFSIGLFKKVFIADGMAEIASPVFDGALAGMIVQTVDAWSAAIAYTLQLYFDFSGYSDMAIGAALLFNIKLPVNFNSPYKSKSIIDFWRRWHITLSRFLREYLYFPLGGGRGGKFKRYRNLMITMLLGGMWHGAGWSFIIWGGWHGILLIANHGWHRIAERGRSSGVAHFTKVIAWPLTLLCVILGWVVFRAESFASGKSIIVSMFISNSDCITPNSFYDDVMITSWIGFKWIFIITFSLIALFAPNSCSLISVYEKYNARAKAFCIGFLLVIVVICLLINLGRSGSSEFIYFNF